MNRRTAIAIVLAILFAGLVFGVVYLNNQELFDFSKETAPEDSQSDVVEIPVASGEITHTYELDVCVVFDAPDVYLASFVIENVTDTNFEMLKKNGEYVKPDESLYRFNNAEKQTGFNGKVIDVYFEKNDGTREATVVLLNLNKLYLIAEVDIEKYKVLNYDSKVSLMYGGKEFSSQILSIGYEISNKKVPITLALPTKLSISEKILPGTEMKAVFVLGVQEAGLYVPVEAIYQDGDSYFADVKDEDTTKQVKVVPGERFSIEEDGQIFEYVEVLSGLSKGDVLIVETLKEIGSSIKENLENG